MNHWFVEQVGRVTVKVLNRKSPWSIVRQVNRKLLTSDSSKCTGCELCIDACSSKHSAQSSLGDSRIAILRDDPSGNYIPTFCLQCDEHPCVNACPVDAINYDDRRSIFVVDEKQCIECGECVKICPYQGIFSQGGQAMKCDLCDGDPACVKVCYPQALKYQVFSREEIVETAQRRISELEGQGK
jgi:carbon-monoxide dehydrogenase iron sulfur subunit